MLTENRSIASAAKHVALTILGKTLRKARLHAQLSQQAVGSHIGVTGQTVRNWETGRNEPSQETIDSLASLYNLHPEELRTDTPLLHPTNHGAHSRKRIKVDPLILVQARRATGLSQSDASKRSAVNIASIRRYERGAARPTRAALQRLALIYGKPPSWLDPDCPNAVTILEPSQLDVALRIYLELQPDLTAPSIKAIAEFTLLTYQKQTEFDREQNACPLEH